MKRKLCDECGVEYLSEKEKKAKRRAKMDEALTFLGKMGLTMIASFGLFCLYILSYGERILFLALFLTFALAFIIANALHGVKFNEGF